MTDVAGEKVLGLSELELLRMLEDNVGRLLHGSPMQQVAVGEFLGVYAKTCCGPLCLEDFRVSTVPDLISKISHLAKVCCLNRAVETPVIQTYICATFVLFQVTTNLEILGIDGKV